MLQNAYFVAKIGADTAENEQHFAEILPKIGNYPTGPAPPGPFQPAYPGEGLPPPVAAYDPYDPYGAPLAGSLDRFKIWNAHGKDHPFKSGPLFFGGLKYKELAELQQIGADFDNLEKISTNSMKN